MPVPTKGASGMMSGTACFCMLAPIRARWASSCSTKGMSDVATEMICLVETSISSTSSGLTKSISTGRRGRLVRRTHAKTGTDRSATNEDAVGLDGAELVDFGVGLGDDVALFFVGREVLESHR